ncbi:hypothetical protein GCM10018772_58220 [Streptomyces fumanus]|uniref:Uncharacterized protein n=2 Tax=Streptomyces fumanus TaxID=67302 RepID=A0A919E8B8_9ACTN|nr:hypothetical protein GCM10018772_58220 [Streptomyces fumanus]
MAAGTASANGVPGAYMLCSQGTYSSFIQQVGEPSSDGWEPLRSFTAHPGECVPIYLGGNPVDVYLRYDDGGVKNLGRAWYQANIATTGYKSTASWHFF